MILKPEEQEAIDFCEEVCQRCDALGTSMAAFPVEEVRRLIATARRLEMVAKARAVVIVSPPEEVK